MIECKEKCRHSIDGICTHDDPEFVFSEHDSGICFSYERDWRRDR